MQLIYKWTKLIPQLEHPHRLALTIIFSFSEAITVGAECRQAQKVARVLLLPCR